MFRSQVSGARVAAHLIGLLTVFLGFATVVHAQAPSDAGVPRLRRLLNSGALAAVEMGADSLLAATPQSTRADSLLRSDLLGLWVEARLRQGLTTTDPTPSRIEELQRMRTMLFDPNDLEIALSLDFVGILYREQHDALRARASFERALQIREQRLGAQHLETAKSLNHLATLAFASQDFARAASLLSRALAITEARLPADHPALAAPLLNLALARSALDDTTHVRQDLTRALRILESSAGPSHPLTLKTLQSLGTWSLTHGDWAEASRYLGLARERCERFDPGSDEHLDALIALARLHLATGQADSARIEAAAAQSLVDARHGRDSNRAAAVTALRADAARSIGATEDARVLYTQSIQLLARAGDADSVMLADALEGAGLLEAESDTPARALPLFERALRIEWRQKPMRARETAYALMGRATALRGLSQFDSATAAYSQARALIERTVPSGDPLRADPLMGLAGLARDTKDLVRARAYADSALSIRQKTLPASHPRIGQSLHLLGMLEKDLGHLDAAKTLLEQGLARFASSTASNSDRAQILNSLGVLERQRGRPAEARSYFERALDHPAGTAEAPWRVRALALRNLGSLANASGDHATAIARYGEARSLHEAHGDSETSDIASIVAGLGNAAKGLGRYDEAETLYRKAISLHRQLLGRQHPTLAIDFHNLAATMLETNALEAALDTALLAENIARQHLRLVAAGLPEQEALHYAAGRVHGLDIALTAAARLPDTTAWRRAWDGVIRSRSLVLDEIAERRRTIAETRNPELARLAAKLALASDRLAHLTVRGKGASTTEQYLAAIEAAHQERDAAERVLAERSDSFRRGSERRSIGLDQVLAALPEEVSLIGYVSFNRLEAERAEGEVPVASAARKGVAWYGAFVLSGRTHDLRFIMLAPSARVEACVARWQHEAAEGWRGDPALAEASYREAGKALREVIWDSLEVHLQGVKRAFVVPDGVLHLVNLTTLPTGPRGYLIEDGPRLHLLSSERDIVELAGEAATGTGLLTTAAVDFLSPRTTARAALGGDGLGRRGAQCSAFQSLWFDSLPGTRVEQGNLVRTWSKFSTRLASTSDSKARRQDNALVLTLAGKAATEREVRTLAPGRSVLHLATHGFFLDRECAGSIASDAEDEDATESLPMDQQSPLLLSGLALAGANARGKALSGDDDGILTAEEIAALDLSSVNWAVLSACQTGLGEVRAGEGVFGLRRAFEVAGARTLIMTLWSVDDRASAMWMESLFDKRLRGRRPTMDAVHDATLELLKEQRSQSRHTHPFFWGPFVAVGDWK